MLVRMLGVETRVVMSVVVLRVVGCPRVVMSIVIVRLAGWHGVVVAAIVVAAMGVARAAIGLGVAMAAAITGGRTAVAAIGWLRDVE